MNAAVEPVIWTSDRMTVEWLNPARYGAIDRMYLAARVTRSYRPPTAVIAAAEEHLDRWYAEFSAHARANIEPTAPAAWGVIQGAWDRKPLAGKMADWLQTNIVDQFHDSVMEFAGQELTVWIGGVSLGTIRDVDRHRRFSYEELTTRKPAFYLEAKRERLEQIVACCEVPLPNLDRTTRGFLLDLFYAHPKRETGRGLRNLDRYLLDCARGLLGYLQDCLQEEGRTWDGDDARGRLPLALRAPFLMAGNQRDWFEAIGKRKCYRCGMHEYVTLFRGIAEVLQRAAPFVREGAARWCPMQLEPEQCCATAWQASAPGLAPGHAAENN